MQGTSVNNSKMEGFDVNWGFALFLSPVVTVKLITTVIE
jgi:hypothetical protein